MVTASITQTPPLRYKQATERQRHKPLMEDIYILLNTGLAMILGGVLGFEREVSDKPAGLRTHMLVCGAAALIVSVADIVLNYMSKGNPPIIQTDPLRIIEAVITGVSFLGAGTILRQHGTVSGLTTAAGLLFAAVIGICVGIGALLLAIGGTLLALLTLSGASFFEHMTHRHRAGKQGSQTEE